jgi:hypothetical protein
LEPFHRHILRRDKHFRRHAVDVFVSYMMIPGEDARIPFMNVGSAKISDIVIYLFHLSLQNKILNYESKPSFIRTPVLPPHRRILSGTGWSRLSRPLLCLAHTKQTKGLTYVRRPTQFTLRTDGSRCLFTRSSVNSPTFDKRLKDWKHQWSEPICPLFWLGFDLKRLGFCFSSLENALLSKEPNSILSQLLVQFIINLKPQTRNLR